MKSACILAFLACLIASSFAQLDSSSKTFMIYKSSNLISDSTQAGSPEFNSTCIQFGQLLGSSKPPQGIQMNNSLVCLVMMVREPTVTVDKVLSSSPLTRVC
jgi:hypothetical protein